MSKPLATKVSTPLSENVQIGTKESIFCVATVIFQHCLNPLGHGVHQSFTGCHCSPLPLLHDDITELMILETMRSSTFHLRMPYRLPLPSASLARQWLSWRLYLGSLSCWNTALRPSLRKGADHTLLQYVTVHVGIHGSINEL